MRTKRALRLMVFTLACLLPVVGVAAPASARSVKPTVSSLSSHSSALGGGAVLTVGGSHFTPATRVTIGGRAVHQIGRATSSRVRVRVPEHGAGTVYVRVRTSHGLSARSSRSALNFIAAPSATSVSPRYAPVSHATAVTITGRNLGHASGVYFGSTYAAVSARTSTYVRAVMPARSAGSVAVRVRSPYGNSGPLSLAVLSAPRITTSTLAAGTVAYAYAQTLATADHRAGSWSITRGALPAGLRLTGATIAGTPTHSGATDLSLRFTDLAGQRVDKTIGLVVSDPFTASTFNLPADAKAGSGGLSGVDCPTRSMCAAVGEYTTTDGTVRGLLAQRVDGVWTATAMGDVNGVETQLAFGAARPVSCGSDGSCVALGTTTGTSFAPVLATLDGGVWTTAAAPVAGGQIVHLRAVSCGATDSCTVVGDAGNDALLLTNTGGTWTRQTLPDSPYGHLTILQDVDCISSTECTAVGNRLVVLVGSSGSWTQALVPDPTNAAYTQLSSDTDLTSVDCPTSTTCTAVGEYDAQALVATQTASGWVSSSPSVGRLVLLRSVSCTISQCVAAGGRRDTPAPTGVLGVLHGISWASVGLSTGTTDITGVSCPADSSACAVSGSGLASDVDFGLIGTVSGTTAVLERAPVPADSVQRANTRESSQVAISCPHADTCVSVGGYSTVPGGSSLIIDGKV